MQREHGGGQQQLQTDERVSVRVHLQIDVVLRRAGAYEQTRTSSSENWYSSVWALRLTAGEELLRRIT